MTRKKRNSVPALSLFPFLAVLLCTMGILVVFLFVSVRIAGNRAQLVRSDVVTENGKLIQQVQADTQLAGIRIEGWEEMRKQRNAELQDQRVRHSQLLNQIDEIREENERLVASYQDLANRKTLTDANTAAEMKSIRDQSGDIAGKIERVRSELDESGSEDRPTMYSLVPWSGSGGTLRRPIYVECTRDAVILQPSGIRLGPDDFAEPDMPGNPLDAALGDIREYWLRNRVAGDNGKPYPLLVVRPDGSASYAIARRAMKNWNDEFGYELIAQDLELDFGESDPELDRQLALTLERSREVMAKWHERMEQQRLAGQRMQQASRQQLASSGMRASRSGGGFVNQGGSAFGDASKGTANRGSHAPSSTAKEMAAGPEQSASASSVKPDSQYVRSDGGTGNAASESPGDKPGGPGGPSEVMGSGSGLANESGGTASDKSAAAENTESSANCACIADHRGEGWAVSRTRAQRTAYVRPIVVWCDAEKFRIDTGRSSWLNVPDVRFEKNDTLTAENLAVAVKQVTDSWGTPPEFGYWRPELRMRVLSGGETRASQIDRLMDRSGILIAEGEGK